MCYEVIYVSYQMILRHDRVLNLVNVPCVQRQYW